MCMDKKYEVKVTRQAMAQMKEIVHYISAELLAPEAANKLLDKMRDANRCIYSFYAEEICAYEGPWKHRRSAKELICKKFPP